MADQPHWFDWYRKLRAPQRGDRLGRAGISFPSGGIQQDPKLLPVPGAAGIARLGPTFVQTLLETSETAEFANPPFVDDPDVSPATSLRTESAPNDQHFKQIVRWERDNAAPPAPVTCSVNVEPLRSTLLGDEPQPQAWPPVNVELWGGGWFQKDNGNGGETIRCGVGTEGCLRVRYGAGNAPQTMYTDVRSGSFSLPASDFVEVAARRYNLGTNMVIADFEQPPDTLPAVLFQPVEVSVALTPCEMPQCHAPTWSIVFPTPAFEALASSEPPFSLWVPHRARRAWVGSMVRPSERFAQPSVTEGFGTRDISAGDYPTTSPAPAWALAGLLRGPFEIGPCGIGYGVTGVNPQPGILPPGSVYSALQWLRAQEAPGDPNDQYPVVRFELAP